MTEFLEIDCLRIRCRAKRGELGRALSIRSRLEHAARTHLPDALRRRPLTRHGERLFITRLDVPLDFDPTAYDDVTVAVRWADSVRRALERKPANRADAGVRRFTNEREWLHAALAELCGSGTLDWVFGELGCGPRPTVLELLAAFDTRARVVCLGEILLADDALDDTLRRQLGRAGRTVVAEGLAGTRGWGRWRDGPHGSGVEPGRSSGASQQSRAEPGPPIVAERSGARTVPDAGGTPDPIGHPQLGDNSVDSGDPAASRTAWRTLLRRVVDGAGRELRVGRSERAAVGAPDLAPRHPRAKPTRVHRGEDSGGSRVTGEAESRRSTQRGHDLSTRVAGVVLLYPFLAAALEWRAEPTTWRGVPDQISARLRVLVAIAGDVQAEARQDAPWLDPLLLLLAGLEPRAIDRLRAATPTVEMARHLPIEAGDEVVAKLGAVLRLDGRASPKWLRSQLIARPGRLEQRADGAIAARLAHRPADVLLSRLPYPLGPFRLPWSPTIDVRMETAS